MPQPMIKEKTRLFVYINAFAAALMDDPVIKSYITEKLSTDDWSGFKNDMSVLPDMVSKDTELQSFFDGLSVEQYATASSGGIWINPMYTGLMFTDDKWESVINNNDFDQTFLYLDIPYEVYEQTAGKKQTKEVYQSQSDSLQARIDEMKSSVPKKLH